MHFCIQKKRPCELLSLCVCLVSRYISFERIMNFFFYTQTVACDMYETGSLPYQNNIVCQLYTSQRKKKYSCEQKIVKLQNIFFSFCRVMTLMFYSVHNICESLLHLESKVRQFSVHCPVQLAYVCFVSMYGVTCHKRGIDSL